jgi:hypothetical protein
VLSAYAVLATLDARAVTEAVLVESHSRQVASLA